MGEEVTGEGQRGEKGWGRDRAGRVEERGEGDGREEKGEEEEDGAEREGKGARDGASRETREGSGRGKSDTEICNYSSVVIEG